MNKVCNLLIIFIMLSGCAETLALLGPASTSVTGGNLAQSAVSSAVSYGVKKQTGKSPVEHAMTYVEEHNPEKKKSNCVVFLNSTESEICEAVKKNIKETKEYFINKNKIVVRSKIDDLAKITVIYNRR